MSVKKLIKRKETIRFLEHEREYMKLSRPISRFEKQPDEVKLV
jgi:hypothetical protein